MSKKRRRVPMQRPHATQIAPRDSRRVIVLPLAAFALATVVLWSAVIFMNSPATSTKASKSAPSESSLATFSRLILMSDEELALQDIALVNLRCAEGLPGSEKLNVSDTLHELDRWATRVRIETDRNFHLFAKKPDDFQNSEAYFRMLLLVTVLQQDYGVHYNGARVKDVDFARSEDLFIHGMIGNKNGGTCVSMPVLYTAVARRLGYPVFLVNAKEHVFCRWDGHGERVNVEGTNQGMNSFDDKHYLSWPHPTSHDEVVRGIYLKSLNMSESFSLFLASRGHCQEDNDDRANASVSYSLAVKHSPTNPNYQIFLRRLVKPKTIEDFPELMAEQEAIQKRDMFAPPRVPNPNAFGNSPVGPQQSGADPSAAMQPSSFTTFPYGVPGR